MNMNEYSNMAKKSARLKYVKLGIPMQTGVTIKLEKYLEWVKQPEWPDSLVHES